MLEAKAKNQGRRRNCSPKKQVFKRIFQAMSKNKVFKTFFQAIFKKEVLKFFSGYLQNFNNSKNSAVFEPKTGQFLRT